MNSFPNLPEIPLDLDYEDFIAAHLVTSGFYIERSITETDDVKILEIDLILTQYLGTESHLINNILVEIKSKDWNFTDYFKIYGWMNYLGINKGYFIVQDRKEIVDILDKKGWKTNIDVLYIDPTKPHHYQTCIESDEEIESNNFIYWRYYNTLERKVLQKLYSNKKIHKGDSYSSRYKILIDYYDLINNRTFFEEYNFDKISALYSKYQEHPHLSSRCGNEINGGQFDTLCSKIPSNVFNDTFYNCKLTDINFSTFLEYKSRLSILKASVDLIAQNEANLDELNFLPDTFLDGLTSLSTNEFFYRYPIVWQWFTGIFGGFFLEEHEEFEKELLAYKSKIPVEEIDFALLSFDYLFPTDGDWIISNRFSKISQLLLFPPIVHGIGANYRLKIYGVDELYDIPSMDEYTFRDLDKWSSLAQKFLSQ